MYDIYDLMTWIPLVLLVIYWWRSSEQKRIALAAARSYCKERNLQLLDETLLFEKFSFDRTWGKGRTLVRKYSFDYCLQGQDRHTGEIILSGYRVLRIILQSDVLDITEFGN
ncbi:MAG: DUF3301 domain-containing protein [Pseudomonadota bacterium]